MSRGKFIVFEGINGCGKGTQINKFFAKLYGSMKGTPVIILPEPNCLDENGQLARQMLSSDGDPYTNSLKAVEYFAKNRRTGNQLSYDLFNSGAHKISDRYWHSNFAFQHAQGIPYKNIAEANEWSSCPDLTFILDVTPEEALSRIQNRDGKDRRKFEVDLEFTRKVRANYLELPRVLPELLNDNSIQIINGMRNPDEIAEEIWTTYQRFKN